MKSRLCRRGIKIILARHARAEHNVASGGVFAGARVDSTLSDKGKREAVQLAKMALEAGDCNLIVASALRRSYQTAQIVAGEIRKRGGDAVEVKQTPLLNEADAGKFTGKTKEEVSRLYSDQAKAFYRGEVDYWGFPGGESAQDLKRRAKRLFDWISHEAPCGATVLVIGHGMFNRVILRQIFPSDKSLWKIDNCSHSQIHCFSLPFFNSAPSILLVGWYFYPQTGGAETIMLNQALGFVGKGYKVTVLSSAIEGKDGEETYKGIKIIRCSLWNTHAKCDLGKLEARFGKILSDCAASIVHFHNGSYPSGVKDVTAASAKVKAVFKTARKMDVKLVEHAHSAHLKAPDKTAPLRHLRWDLVICVSGFVKGKWEEFGHGAEKLAVVYNGTDLDRFKKASENQGFLALKTPGEKLIFFPGRIISMSTGKLGKQKNFALLLEACRLLLERGQDNFKVAAVFNETRDKARDDQTKRELREKISNYGLTGKIKFFSPINPNKMPGYYAASDIVCVPSREETFGLVYLEAMALGRVAIASNTGAPKEYVKNGVNGFLVDPDDPNELTKVLSKLLSGEELAGKIGRRAKMTARKFSADKLCAGIDRAYRDLRECRK